MDFLREHAFIISYIVIVSIIGVIVTAKDKISAIKGGRRTPEMTLFMLSALGGSLMIFIMMLLIRHKTKHKKFMIGIPLIMIVQAVLIYLICTML